MDKKFKNRNDYLLQQIERNNIDEIEIIFKKFPELFKQKNNDPNNWTPLKLACRFGNIKLLKKLLNLGMELENENISTLLLLSCYSNNKDVLKFLLKYKEEFEISELNSLCSISLIFKNINFTYLFTLLGAKILDDENNDNLYPINFKNKLIENENFISIKDKKISAKVSKDLKDNFYYFKFKVICNFLKNKNNDKDYFHMFRNKIENNDLEVLKEEIKKYL